MGIEVMIVVLIAFMFIAGLIAVESNDLLSSVIALGAIGFGLSVIDLLLGAPDLAITQVVVEIIALVLLIRLVLTRRDTSKDSPRDALRTAVVLLASGVFLVVGFLAVGGISQTDKGIPEFGKPLLAKAEIPGELGPGVGKDYLEETARAQHEDTSGCLNAVTAILLDFRAYDTLGEATVIFVSILGAYALLRHVGRRKEVADK